MIRKINAKLLRISTNMYSNNLQHRTLLHITTFLQHEWHYIQLCNGNMFIWHGWSFQQQSSYLSYHLEKSLAKIRKQRGELSRTLWIQGHFEVAMKLPKEVQFHIEKITRVQIHGLYCLLYLHGGSHRSCRLNIAYIPIAVYSVCSRAKLKRAGGLWGSRIVASRARKEYSSRIQA